MANQDSMDQAFINKLIDILEANLDNEQFGVEELADAIGLSRSQLFRKLNSLTGKSISQYIREYRLKKAMEMLQNNVATASEIAYKVGFGSPTYFNTSFHQYYGFPPGEAKLRGTSALKKEHNDESSDFTNFSGTIQSKPFKIKPLLIISIATILLATLLYYVLVASNNVSEIQSSEKVIVGKSIAILPFKSLTKDDESQYLADGLRASIQNHLNLIPNLRVISAKTMEQFRESPKFAHKIAEELNVSFLLDASVQKYDNKVRIIVQLINGRTDEQIWSKDFEREFKDIFILQSDISKNVAKELELVISPLKQKQIEKIPTNSIEAYNLYVKGSYFKGKGGPENYDMSIRYYEQALELDPGFALAYSGLSMSKLRRQIYDLPNRKQLVIIKELSLKAIELDSTIAEAHTVLAMLESIYNLNWKKAEHEFKLSLQLNPNLADTYFNYAIFLHNVKGDFIESRKNIDQVLLLDPLSYSGYAKSAEYYLSTSDYQNAFSETKKAKEIDNANLWAYWVDFENYVAQGKYDMAINELVASWSMNPGNIENAKALKVAYETSGIKGVYHYINDFDIRNGNDSLVSYWVAQKFAFVGDKEKALDYLEKTYNIDRSGLYPMKYDNYFKDLRSEPRFLKLLTKMKLGDYEKNH